MSNTAPSRADPVVVIMTIMITVIKMMMMMMMIKTIIIIITILLCDYNVINTNLTRCYMVFIKSMHHDRPNITYLLSPNPGIFLGDIHHSLTGVWKLGLCHKHFMSSWLKFYSHYFYSNFDFKNPSRSHFWHMPRQCHDSSAVVQNCDLLGSLFFKLDEHLFLRNLDYELTYH